MLRRSTAQLMLRRTPVRASGHKVDPIIDPKEIPSADEVTGSFGRLWVGEQKMVRCIDPLWLHNRLIQCHRDAYIAICFFWPATYFIFWGAPNALMWGDGAAPRHPDWNQKDAGRLPAGFKMTTLTK